jgi:hypothetical protein
MTQTVTGTWRFGMVSYFCMKHHRKPLKLLNFRKRVGEDEPANTPVSLFHHTAWSSQPLPLNCLVISLKTLETFIHLEANLIQVKL